MKKSYTVFYSWQSDKKKNRNFISSAIEKAIKDIKKNGVNEINLEINLDRDTRNTSGSPSISHTIFDKISQSDIFICDVSLINNCWLTRVLQLRLTPNPNVLIELGYAIKHLGWERIICVNNEEYGSNELLPFDIRGHRITTFQGHDTITKKNLASTMKSAINSIISDFDNIEKRFNDSSLKQHDKNVFENIQKILPEGILKDDLSTITTNLYYNNLHHDRWIKLREYYNDSMNHFINPRIHQNMLELINLIDKFWDLCYGEIQVERNSKPTLRELQEMKTQISEEERCDALQNERYFAKKEPIGNETWPEANKRMDILQQKFNELKLEIRESYRILIENYKKEIAN